MVLLERISEIKEYLDEITLKSVKNSRGSYKQNIIKYTSQLIGKPIYLQENGGHGDCDACVDAYKESYLITLFESRKKYNNTFILGHELGHLLLGHYNFKCGLRGNERYLLNVIANKKTGKEFSSAWYLKWRERANVSFWTDLAEILCDEIGEYILERIENNELSKSQLKFLFDR